MNKLNARWREKKNQIVKCYLLIKPEIENCTYFVWLTNILSPKGEKCKEVSWIVLGVPDSWRVLFVLLLWPIPLYIVIICVFLFCLNHWLLKARDCIVLLFFFEFCSFLPHFSWWVFFFILAVCTSSLWHLRDIMKIRAFDINHK